jgi:hypothetical protein
MGSRTAGGPARVGDGGEQLTGLHRLSVDDCDMEYTSIRRAICPLGTSICCSKPAFAM